VLQCAGNGRGLYNARVPGVQWTHGAMGQATWTGVPLRALLERAGIPKDASHVWLEGADRPPMPTVPCWQRSSPLESAMDESTLVAWAMNGEPLALAHGAPFRLVVPGWTGNHWMKWLRSVRLENQEAGGFFMKTGYRMPTVPLEPGTPLKPELSVPVTTFGV